MKKKYLSWFVLGCILSPCDVSEIDNNCYNKNHAASQIFKNIDYLYYSYSTSFFPRFVQFIGSLGGVDVDPTCFTPRSPEHSVILQYSNNGGKPDITFYLLKK